MSNMRFSHKTISPLRRHCLKLGLSSVFFRYIPWLLLGLASTKNAQSFPATHCVRSPWAYYPLSENGSNKALEFGNEALPSLLPLTNDPFQWVVDGWLGNGVDAGLEVPWSADTVGFDVILLPCRGAYLVGVLIDHPANINGSEVIFRAGQMTLISSGQLTSELELKINIYGRATAHITDDNGKRVTITIPEVVPDTNNGSVIIFAYIDHRIGGHETASIYRYIPGTIQKVVRSKSISSLGDISGGLLSPDKLVNIGCRRNGYGRTLKHFNGKISHLNIINFDKRPPDNIDAILDEFSLNHMLPGTFLEGK